MKRFVFYLALGMLFTHELDAVLNQEWRVMPLLRALPDAQGASVFVAMHVPLFALIVAFVASRSERVRRLARLIVCGFLLLHAGLHYGFSRAPAYAFESALSDVLIYGGAALGGLFLLHDVLTDRAATNR